MREFQGPFTANGDEVVAKIIDGELIIIRLSDGTYYSMDNVGAQVWELFEARHDVGAVTETIATWYGEPVERVGADIDALVRDLVGERLIVATAAHDADGGGLQAPPSELPPYETPRLNIYRDMGNLLALDPPTPGIDDIPLGPRKAR